MKEFDFILLEYNFTNFDLGLNDGNLIVSFEWVVLFVKVLHNHQLGNLHQLTFSKKSEQILISSWYKGCSDSVK